MAPPDPGDPNAVYQRARILDGCVDAINATDGSGANCHMSSVGVCSLLTREGLPNRNGLTASFLSMGITSGLTTAIMNPLHEPEMQAVRGGDVMMGRDPTACSGCAATAIRARSLPRPPAPAAGAEVAGAAVVDVAGSSNSLSEAVGPADRVGAPPGTASQALAKNRSTDTVR